MLRTAVAGRRISIATAAVIALAALVAGGLSAAVPAAAAPPQTSKPAPKAAPQQPPAAPVPKPVQPPSVQPPATRPAPQAPKPVPPPPVSRPAVPEAKPGDAPIVAPTFAWPVGASAAVEVELTRERSIGAEATSTQARARYRITVEEHPRGLRIKASEFQFDASGDQATAMQGLVERLSAAPVSYIVARNGALLEVEKTEALRTAVLARVEELAGGNLAPEMRQLFDALLSKENFQARTAELWKDLVTGWSGSRLTLGETYVVDELAPAPVDPTIEIPTLFTYSVKRLSACGEGLPAGTECVELESRVYPREEAMRREVGRAIARVLTPALNARMEKGGASFERLESERVATLATDPRTLLPFRLERVRRLDATMIGGGEPVAVEQTDRVRYTFRWQPAPPAPKPAPTRTTPGARQTTGSGTPAR